MKEREDRAGSLQCVTRGILGHVPQLAEECGATAIFVYAGALGGAELPLPERLRRVRVHYVTRSAEELRRLEARGLSAIRAPDVALNRMGQAQMAIFLAMSRVLVKPGDVVLCLAGPSEQSALDTFFITEVGRELEMYRTAGEDRPPDVLPEVLERVVHIAAELAGEGREGKPVGVLFVVGDTERTRALSRQLILNPFQGYPERERNVLTPALEETVKELSALDGAFLVRGDGVLVTCGAFLNTAAAGSYDLPPGLGARHHAAAAITAVTESMAVVVSESTGRLTVFRGGRPIVGIDKAQHARPSHRL